MDRPWDRYSKLFLSIASMIQNETLHRPGESPSSAPVDGPDSPLWKKASNVTVPSLQSAEEYDEEADEFSVPYWVFILMTSLYACIFVLGVSGNLLVILVIAKDRRMRTTANFYLISLSVADLMIIAFCLPVAVYELHAEEVWNLGPVLCKLAPLLQYLSTNASICTMVAISIERYIVVCRPLKIRTYCTNARACGLIIVLWLFSLACSSPLLQFTRHEIDYHQKIKIQVYVCYINHFSNEAYFYFHQLCFYVLPGLLFCLVYSQIVRKLRRYKSERFGHSPDSRRITAPGSKSQSDTRQLIFMLSAVVLSYFVCLLPYNCITFLSLVSHRTLVELGPIGYNVFLAFSRIMFFVNSCTNPIMYNALSGKFRDAFKKFFCPKRYKNLGDSRSMSVRSARTAGEEDNLLNCRLRAAALEMRLRSGNGLRTQCLTSAAVVRRTQSNTCEAEKDHAAALNRFNGLNGCRCRHHSMSKLRRLSSCDDAAVIRHAPVKSYYNEAKL